MGKTRKSTKNMLKHSEKVPLDEQITSGRVARNKNKSKVRLRADDEEEVYILVGEKASSGVFNPFIS